MPDDNIYEDTLYSVINGYTKHALMNTRTSFPGIIESFDEATQTAAVQPALKATMGNGDTVTLPKLIDVPLLFPRAGGFSITFPVKAGDEVLITCCDRDFSAWLQLGGPQLPDSKKLHAMDSAVGVLGLYNQTNVLEDFDTSGMVLRSDDDATKITIEDGKITVDAATLAVNVPTSTWTGDITHLGNTTHTGNVVQLGNFTQTGGMMMSNTIIVSEHVHTGVTAGGALTGQPAT